MKRLKKETSLLLVIALVISTIALGFGQLTTQAAQASSQLGTFRVSARTNSENCTGVGTDADFEIFIIYDDAGTYYSGNFVPDDDMEASETDVWVVSNVPVRPISSILFRMMESNSDWSWDWVKIEYCYDGTNWVEAGYNDGDGIMGSSGATISFNYNEVLENTYTRTLTWSGNGGTVNGGSNYIVTAIQGATYPNNSNNVPNLLRTGYTFTGWSPAVPTAGPSANTTYTAQWTPNNINITFDANGGTGGTGPTSMQFDAPLTAPTVTRTGYTFINWLPAVPATVPIVDTTYTAQWRETNPAITFNSNGGSAVEAITPGYNNSALKPTDPTMTGFTFGGWYLEPELNTAVNWPFTVTQSTVFYAEWNAENCYTIIFAANGGAGGTTASMAVGDTLTAPAVTKTGYTLAGWSPIVPAAVPAERTIYTAQWAANTYTVSYNGNGNDAGNTASSLHTYDIASPLTVNGFTKVGNSLAGWSTDSGATAPVYTDGQSVLNLTPNQSEVITLYAVWSINSYTITFSANGGSGGTSSSKLYGSALTVPTVTRTGYTFAGWLPDVPATVPAADTTYTAQWTANQYEVTFDPQGGAVTPTTSTVTYGSTYGAGTGGWPTPTRTGYTFGGWYTGTNGSGSSRSSTSTVTTALNHTLYAKWTGIRYYVYYDGNGSTGGSNITTTHNYGTAKALTANGFTNTGFAFAGWATSADGAVVYTDKQSVSNLTEISEAIVTLYAKWTDVNVSTITFDANGGTGGTGPTSMQPGAALTAPAVTRAGYVLSGWSPSVPATVPAESTTYTAQWTARTFTVTFNPQSGTVSPATSTVTYDSTYGAGTGGWPTPTRTGYTFGGWYTSTNGGGTQIFSTTMAARTYSQTLYAKWTANTYLVTFDPQGGSVSPETITVTYAGTYGTLPTPTRTGYTFGGWYPSTGGTGTKILSTNTVTITAAQTLYAQWTTSTVNITFDANGGTGGTGPTAMTPGAVLTAPTVTRTGYTFNGWTPTVPATVPAVDTTYTAQWAIAQAYFTWNPNGGTWWDGSTGSKTTTTTTPPGSLSRNGYTFSGWSPAPTQAPMTCTAQWSINYYTITFDANGGTGGTSGLMACGTPLTAPVVTREGYTFIGWTPYVPSTVPASDTIYKAQWGIAFGSYPQTLVTNASLITALNLCTPDSDNNVNYDGSKYKRVYFTEYTPITTDSSPSAAYSYQDNNGYYVNTVYWVKFEPILWRILSNENGGLLLMSEKILDAKPYNQVSTSLTWETCTLRSWINTDFYNTAFSTADKTKIIPSSYIPEQGSNSINDNLFLLSISEVESSSFGFNSNSDRITQGTDFSKSDGLKVEDGINSMWWLRDRLGSNLTAANVVSHSGGTGYGFYNNTTMFGIRPVVKINLSASASVQITFNANGGTGGTGPTAMTTGDMLTAPAVTRPGYIFTGWSPEVPATVPAENQTYVAQWDIDLTETVQFTVSSSEGVSGDIITVSITISENSNIGAANFELPFDPGLLEYISATAGAALTSGMADINFDAVNNKIIMTYINSEGLTAGGSVLNVQFRIKNSASPQTINTNFEVIELTDSNIVPLHSTITQGTIVVTCMLGDINGGGSVTVVDALMALQAASGKIILTGSQKSAADVNKDGVVSAVDALKILQYASGKITSF